MSETKEYFKCTRCGREFSSDTHDLDNEIVPVWVDSNNLEITEMWCHDCAEHTEQVEIDEAIYTMPMLPNP